jgi:hypothetical protein
MINSEGLELEGTISAFSAYQPDLTTGAPRVALHQSVTGPIGVRRALKHPAMLAESRLKQAKNAPLSRF